MGEAQTICLLLYPGLTQLDLTAPFEVLSRLPGVEMALAWKEAAPVTADRGLTLQASTSFAACPQADVLCVPGGPGQVELMEDQEVLSFLRDQAAGCSYLTSVCTGSLLLGAAGLLRGYRATCHWLSLDQLSLFGALPVRERVVADRNRITAAGVSAGLDFALFLARQLRGEEAARAIQLSLEYDPQPPYLSGSPQQAGEETVRRVEEATREFQKRRREASERAARALPADSR